VDVEGVLWLDRSTAELRRLEFAYRNLPDAEYQLCDSHPFIVITPEMLEEQPVFKQPAPYCMTLKDGQSNRLGLGGSADFVRLPTGQWLIARWELLTPPDTAVYRKGNRTKIVRGKIERCYSGADCHTVVALVPRLTVSVGVVTRVIREGVTLYSDPVRENLLRAINRRYSGGTGAFSGVITDEAGRSLPNATIRNESPWRVARSDSFGRLGRAN
jgi:hypothetical protein